MIEKLLKNNLNSFYWIGFLLADGHFNEKKGYISLSLSIKDVNHLRKFRKFVGCKNLVSFCKKKETFTMRVYKKNTIKKICEKFDIDQRKTYNPPYFKKYSIFNQNLLISMLVGFIDGDGHIKKVWGRNDCSITITVHKSWKNFLSFLSSIISEKCEIKIPKSRINNRGYAFVYFSNRKVIRFLKKFVIKWKLPVLKRKWSLIDKKAMSHSNTDTEEFCVKMINSGIGRKTICKKLNINKGRLGEILCRNNIRLHTKRFFDQKGRFRLKSKTLNMLSNGIKPKEICKTLGIPINNIYNLRKYHNSQQSL